MLYCFVCIVLVLPAAALCVFLSAFLVSFEMLRISFSLSLPVLCFLFWFVVACFCVCVGLLILFVLAVLVCYL